MLRIYDANNEYRRLLEADSSGLTIRSFIDTIEGHIRNKDVVVVVWDGMDCNARRRAVFPPYKSKRQTPSENIFESIKLAKALLKYTAAIQIEIPKWEADDVIASLVERYRKTMEIFIHSNDGDYLQLGVPTSRENGYANVPPELIRLYKATVGDPSDNIPGIKGFGEKAWEMTNKELLLKAVKFAGHPDAPLMFDVPGVSKQSANWFHQNIEEVKAMWNIVGFIPVPPEEIDAHTIVGKPCRPAIEAALKEFML